jgi:dihydrofolate synthase / folylpolyglutamate synthase
MRTYQETLDYLYTQLPMFQRIGGAAFKKDLTNIRRLCEALGNPQEQFKSIHIAGTNGKGSTAHMLSAIFQSAGYKTGLYTSPHYRDFRERIKINGELLPEQWVMDFVDRHQYLMEEIKPSYFEITVAMAFQYFAEQEVEMAVIEVGLGGRLDSTNIITPELCVITNISYDHMQFLGDTLELIAGEKAGIIKPGIPVVIGETQAETTPVFLAKAEAEGSPISFADQHIQASAVQADYAGSTYVVFRDGKPHLIHLQTELYGEYQRFNLQTVLHAVDHLAEAWQITEEHIRKGLANLRSLSRFVGRWQLLGEDPLILCDSAHNEAGLRLVVDQLSRIPHEQLHMVLGVVDDKDLNKVFPLLPREAIFYFSRPDVPRGLNGRVLADRALEAGIKGTVHTSVSGALAAAKKAAKKDDLIFVGGSIFVVAEVV